jgi:hypothetical protein
VSLAGRLSFAWESPTWGGGIAFYSPADVGTVRATAYLVTARQFSDVFAQEMWREPGTDLDLAPLLDSGRHAVGPGRYETLHVAGTLDDRPVLTFSAPDVAALGLRPPAAAYLSTMVQGLRSTHGLSAEAITDYLLACAGIDPAWDRASLTSLVALVAPTP